MATGIFGKSWTLTSAVTAGSSQLFLASDSNRRLLPAVYGLYDAGTGNRESIRISTYTNTSAAITRGYDLTTATTFSSGSLLYAVQPLTALGVEQAMHQCTVISAGSGSVNASSTNNRGTGYIYTNDFGRAIMVMASFSTTSSGNVLAVVDGVELGYQGSGSGASYMTTTFPVPAGSTYQMVANGSGSSILKWAEMR